jgi:hypothetical protein
MFSTKTLYVFIFYAVAILFVLELSIRLSGFYKTQPEKNNGIFINPYKPQHSGLYYHHTPNTTVNVSVQEFFYTHQYNSLGHRDTNDAKKIDIIILGDSFAEGMGAPKDSSLASLLALKSKQSVYNAGIMGSDIFYNFIDFKDRLVNFNPCKILYVINYSDIYDVLLRGGTERFQKDGSVVYSKEPWYLFVYENSHLFRAFIHLVLRYDFMFNSPSERNINIEKTLRKMADLLIQSQSFCNERGIEMYVFIHPIPQEYYKNLDRRVNFKDIDKLEQLLGSSRINCVNLRHNFEQVLRTPEAWKSISWPIDGHFNSTGYSLYADILHNALAKNDSLINCSK